MSAVTIRAAVAATARRWRGVAMVIAALTIGQGLARAAGGSSGEPGRVRIAARLVDELVRGLLPIEIVGVGSVARPSDGGVPDAPSTLTITHLRYCGVTERAAGRFRAVIQQSGAFADGAASSPLAGDAGCSKSLDALARGASAAATATATAATVAPAAAAPTGGSREIVVADIEALWRPWELRFVIARTSGGAQPKPGQPQPLALGGDGARELMTVSTAGARVPTAAGATLIFHVAPTFASEAIELVMVPGDVGTAPPSARPAAAAAMPGLAAGATAVAELPFSFANQVLRRLTGGDPLPIEIDRDVIDLQNVSLGGGPTAAVVTGTATPRSLREPVRLTAQAGGADLRVNAVKAEASLESCAGLGTLAAIGCGTRNAARNAGAAAVAATITQRYQGQLVRELAGPQELRFELGGRRFELRGELVHLAVNARGLSVAARLEAGEPSH